MKIIKPSFKIETPKEYICWATKIIELAGRTCYKSEDKIGKGTDIAMCQKLKTLEHMSVFEHFGLTVRIICDRGVSHELVRHRLCAFSQESTRYCNYSHEKFGREITVIEPCFCEKGSSIYETWKNGCLYAEETYFNMLQLGATPQEARSVLPNSLKTEIVMTCNLRELEHILNLRCSPKAHPQMREITLPLLNEVHGLIPIVFDQLYNKYLAK